MADADGDQLHRRAVLDLVDDEAQVLFEVVAGVHREGGIVHRRAVGNHHQDAPLLGAGEQALVRPIHRLAVNILLQQALAHHQPEVAARAPPWRVGRLVDDVAQVVEAPRRLRLARLQPRLAGLAALPGAGGEAQNLHLHAATLQRARQNVGAGGRHGDGAPAHGAGVVEQQRHHRVAEVHVLLALEGQRLLRIDDDARQARGVEDAFLQVEGPRAVLLRHQAPLQSVGEARDDGREVAELLVEVGAQALQLLGLAQLLRRDDLVKARGERLVLRAAMLEQGGVGRAPAFRGFLRLAHVGVFGHFARGRVVRVHLSVLDVLGRVLGLLHLHGVAGGILLALALALLGLGIRLRIAAFLAGLVMIHGALVHHVEGLEQLVDRAAEGALVFQRIAELVEFAAAPILDDRAPEFDDALRGLWRGKAGQALAHHHGHSVLQRRVGAVAHFRVRAAVVAILQHGREV